MRLAGLPTLLLGAVVLAVAAGTATLGTTVVGDAASLQVDGGIVQVLDVQVLDVQVLDAQPERDSAATVEP